MAQDNVEELQGPYGPVVISEEILQRIWAHQDFVRDRLTTVSGKSLEIRFPGSWNRAGGPDFLNARLLIDGVIHEGDVEIHFREREWDDHGHANNPAFGKVLLHVILFPSSSTDVSQPRSFKPRETLLWLPHLDRDLESYADETAYSLLGSSVEQEVLAALSRLDVAERRTIIRTAAGQRWERKVSRARTACNEVSPSEVAHRFVLEGLGLSRNRSPMLRLARRFPLEEWKNPEASDLPSRAFHSETGWKLSGLRPINRPENRLRQYHRLCSKAPGWSDHFLQWIHQLPVISPANSTVHFRRSNQTGQLGSDLIQEIFANQISGTRLHTIFTDYLLPLASVQLDTSLEALWFHWYGGDVSSAVERLLRLSGITEPHRHPGSNGWNQGIIHQLATAAAA
ncbi:MAG: DUF2851 family protein [Puniceicoccaceae bacterium]